MPFATKLSTINSPAVPTPIAPLIYSVLGFPTHQSRRVGWVERSETHHRSRRAYHQSRRADGPMMRFTTAQPVLRLRRRHVASYSGCLVPSLRDALRLRRVGDSSHAFAAFQAPGRTNVVRGGIGGAAATRDAGGWRIRHWIEVEDTRDGKSRMLRVVTLEDGETVHNAFFDRNFVKDGP
jgi:hypothetical protein